MHLECHATLGWLLGNLWGGDRKIRNYAVLGSILPDVDALPYVFGPYYYGMLHHTFGHNLFLVIGFSLYGWIRFRRATVAVLGLVAIGSHLLTDAYLSNWPLYLFWPFSKRGYLPANSLDLSSPVNTYLVYAIPAVLLIAALIWKRTPLEWIHPELDKLVIGFFKRKNLNCCECHRGANAVCQTCGRAVCPRHLNVRKRWRIVCSDCGD